MFYTIDDVVKYSRIFRNMPVDISEELRGWSWSNPPLIPPYPLKLSVSDIANEFCETGRFIYLRYVEKAPEQIQPRLARGKLIHDTIAEALRIAKMIIYSGRLEGFREKFMAEAEESYRKVSQNIEDMRETFNTVWSYAADIFSSSLARAKARSPYLSIDSIATLTIPGVSEYPVDGTLIGLTKTIRIDYLLQPSIIVEYKTREYNPIYEVGLAAYALAYESQYETPINHAIIVSVKIDERRREIKYYEKPIAISDHLRQKFIDLRDNLMKIVNDRIDPGKPKQCHPDCPYLKVCKSI
ncbi:MAG: type I-A CRISPR-associated protein Cas4/Csa1 [Candidatus Methanomethylicia archaeon]